MNSTGHRALRQILDQTEKLSILADLYESQGKYADAEILYRRILEIKETALGPDNYELAGDIYDLGLLCYAQDKYEEAEELLLRALSLEEKFLGKDSPMIATTLDTLAQLYYEQGKYAQSVQACKRALAICGKKYSGGSSGLDLGCFELAELLTDSVAKFESDPGVESISGDDLIHITPAGTS